LLLRVADNVQEFIRMKKSFSRAAILIAFALVFFAGCKKSDSMGAPPFENVKLGMTKAGAVALIGSDGQACEHDKLPSTLKPRDAYRRLPMGTEYFVWWNAKTGIAELTLGIWQGLVIYKDAQWMHHGEVRGARDALREFQVSEERSK
jgi:hypothetical protein